MTLPRICETVDLLLDRLPAALKYVWNGDEMVRLAEQSDDVDRPGLYREHTFDLHSGLRLIISLEAHSGPSPLLLNVEGPNTILHVSASWDRTGSVELASLDDLQGLVRETLSALGLQPELAEQAVLTRSVLHIVYGPENTLLLLGRLRLETPKTKTTGPAVAPVRETDHV